MLWSTLLFRILLGQAIACSIAMTGLFSSLLAQHKTSVALLQSSTAYCMMFVLIAPVHVSYCRAEYLRQQQQQQQQQEEGTVVVAKDFRRGQPWYVYGVPGVFTTRFPAWRYVALSVCDVAASFFAIKAYVYTDITSAQLLDTATIFTVMLLGYFLLARRFNWRHFAGVAVALGGMGGLVYIDAENKTRDSDKTAPNAVLGDILTLIASVLYGVTNIGNECLLKSDRVRVPAWMRSCIAVFEPTTTEATAVASQHQRPGGDEAEDTSVLPTAEEEQQPQEAEAQEEEEEEGSVAVLRAALPRIAEIATMVSGLGTIFSSAMLFTTSLADVRDASAHWTWRSTLYQVAFCCVMVVIYVGMPSLLKLTNATFTCLSLLTADVFAVVLNYVTSGVAPTGWYYLTAAFVLVGIFLFDTADAKVSSSASSAESSTKAAAVIEVEEAERSSSYSP